MHYHWFKVFAKMKSILINSHSHDDPFVSLSDVNFVKEYCVYKDIQSNSFLLLVINYIDIYPLTTISKTEKVKHKTSSSHILLPNWAFDSHGIYIAYDLVKFYSTLKWFHAILFIHIDFMWFIFWFLISTTNILSDHAVQPSAQSCDVSLIRQPNTQWNNVTNVNKL